MTTALDDDAIERAARSYRLALPRTALAGRVGGVLGRRAGGSMELHDFRDYQPGDDVRQLDWNALARTDQLVVRTRREEVSPRVELVVDLSRSMALTPAKEARSRELAIVVLRVAMNEGLDPALILCGNDIRVVRQASPNLLRDVAFDGTSPLSESLRRGPSLRACGLRVVLSDFLFETPLPALVSRLTEHAASCTFVQLLATDDAEPELSNALTLIDSETEERLDRDLDEHVLETYRRRFAAHQAALDGAAKRVRAHLVCARVEATLDVMLRERLLGPLFEVAS